MSAILELAAFTLDDALYAAACGVDRIEFCRYYKSGGLTPKVEDLRRLKYFYPEVPVFVMIRPRRGNFYYNDDFDYEKIDLQIKSFIDAGADGFVFGALYKDSIGTISFDLDKCKFILEATMGLPCTFHRAFDLTNTSTQIEFIARFGFKRLLTSGGRGNAIDHLEKLEFFKKYYEKNIIILPGGGIRTYNVHHFLDMGFKEIHSACVDSSGLFDKKEFENLLNKIKK